MHFKFAALVATVLAISGAPPSQSAPTCIVNSKVGAQLDLPVYEWVDRTKPRKGTIVAVHGLTLYAYAWDSLAKHLASRGYHVFALDQRGFGRWRTDAAKFNGNDKIEIGQSQQDLLDLVTSLRQAHPTQPLFMLGESVGSNMSLQLVSDHPELADGAVLGSPCYKTRVHPKPVRWAADLAKQMVRPNKPLNLEPYAAPYLTNDPALQKACDNDPMIFRRMTPAELIKIDVMNDRAIAAAKKLPANYPLQIFAGTKDGMFKSTELPKAIEKFGTHSVSLTLLPGKGHLLLEHQQPSKQITGLMDGWLNHHGTYSLATAPATNAPATAPAAQ